MPHRRTLVAGRGINDADYVTQLVKNGRHWMCPFFSAWNRMIRSHCPVETRWLNFSSFRPWMVRRDWEGKMLDRWLLGDGDTYGPDLCCFLDRVSSSLAYGLSRKETMGIDRPHGDSIVNGYRVSLKGKHIGYFATREEARAAWCKAAVVEFKRRNTNRKHREAVDKLYVKATSVSAEGKHTAN